MNGSNDTGLGMTYCAPCFLDILLNRIIDMYFSELYNIWISVLLSLIDDECSGSPKSELFCMITVFLCYFV